MSDGTGNGAEDSPRRIEPNTIRARHRDLEVDVSTGARPEDELRIVVPASRARTLLARLAAEDETAARRLVDLTVIDRGPEAPSARRFEVVYRLHSTSRQAVLRIHALVDAEDAAIESVTGIWPAADWLEREAFDLFGIHFKGHPDLRRLLLEPTFEGAPLRKDTVRGGEGA